MKWNHLFENGEGVVDQSVGKKFLGNIQNFPAVNSSIEHQLLLRFGYVVTFWNPFVEFDGVAEQLDKSREEADKKFFETQAKKFAKKFGPKFESAKTEEDKKKILAEFFQEMEELKQSVDKQMYEEADEDADWDKK